MEGLMEMSVLHGKDYFCDTTDQFEKYDMSMFINNRYNFPKHSHYARVC